MDIKELHQKALELSNDDRADLASWLLAGLEEVSPDDFHDAWAKEIAKRVNEFDTGKAETISSAAAKERISKLLE